MNGPILFASTNPGKLQEVRTISAAYGVEIVSPAELLRKHGPAPEVLENGSTYLDNARLKALAFAAWSGMPSLADDTGLEVVALGGGPGLYTARYAGDCCSAADNRLKMLRALEGEVSREARFVCVLCLSRSGGELIHVQAELEGRICSEERGRGGFGYDSIFEVSGFQGLTLAEIKEQGIAVKTHRELALEKLFAG